MADTPLRELHPMNGSLSDADHDRFVNILLQRTQEEYRMSQLRTEAAKQENKENIHPPRANYHRSILLAIRG
uniref:GED domain-containing protein n=1 Tax=Caenorhabditis tropicalis TaxID=1561998 RepID=A0A1I7UWS8_9PELO